LRTTNLIAFYWTIGSFAVETLILALICVDDVEVYFSFIRREAYKKHHKGKYNGKRLESLRISLYIALLVTLSKVFIKNMELILTFGL